MSQGAVLYVPVSDSVAPTAGRGPTRYFGAVYRIPKSDYGTIRQLEWERTPGELLAAAPPGDRPPLRRVVTAAIERLEVCDQDTGDIWVMYRVPYAL
jgi:hypothetical protein